MHSLVDSGQRDMQFLGSETHSNNFFQNTNIYAPIEMQIESGNQHTDAHQVGFVMGEELQV